MESKQLPKEEQEKLKPGWDRCLHPGVRDSSHFLVLSDLGDRAVRYGTPLYATWNDSQLVNDC
jgi:hypothetical protein